jgi:DNA-binding IclR family transcriptional regulator
MVKYKKRNYNFVLWDNMKKEKIKSLEKSLVLLEKLSLKEEMSIIDLSKELHLSTSTVYRILNTFKSHGYVIQDQQTSKYSIGAKLLILGNKFNKIKTLLKIVKPFLDKISKYTNETINFAILEDKEVVCVYQVESKNMLRTSIGIGERIPAHSTSLGKVLLAFQPEREFEILYSDKSEKLSTFTPNTISSVKELKESLKKIRKQRYAVDIEELKMGVNCIAVPIINNEGKAMAAISISSPRSRLNLSETEEIEKAKSLLITLCEDISKRLLNKAYLESM